MRTIKIGYAGMYAAFDYNISLVYKMLCKHYQVQVVPPQEADYIICGAFGEKYEYCKYPQIRIMYIGENYIPDFNFIDYAICPYPIAFLDRVFYYPMYAQAYKGAEVLAKKERVYTKDFLQEKLYFANFIAGHESEYGIRGDFFKKLCEYKRVEAPGSYLNNMPNGETVEWTNSSKTDFQRKCKFTLCFESTKNEGFVTEKIMDAFYADTIPVYYGSDTVKDVFNENAFINVADYDSWDAVIERIKELDKNDDEYLEMLNQPIFVDAKRECNVEQELEQFLCHIIDQPYEKAYRRSRVYMPKEHEEFIKAANKQFYKTSILKRLLNKIKE